MIDELIAGGKTPMIFCMKTTVNATPHVHVPPTVDPSVQAEYEAIQETDVDIPRTIRLKIRD